MLLLSGIRIMERVWLQIRAVYSPGSVRFDYRQRILRHSCLFVLLTVRPIVDSRTDLLFPISYCSTISYHYHLPTRRCSVLLPGEMSFNHSSHKDSDSPLAGNSPDTDSYHTNCSGHRHEHRESDSFRHCPSGEVENNTTRIGAFPLLTCYQPMSVP